MKEIKFDFNALFSAAVGKEHGVEEEGLREMRPAAERAIAHLQEIIADPAQRVRLNLEWAALPFQDKAVVSGIQRLGGEIARRFENALFLGIGGSYLGLKAGQDALCPAYYNDFPGQRKGRPRVYFEGNNLDPDTLQALLKRLDPKKTFVVVISKSGETTETKAAFLVVESWLKQAIGKNYGRQILAITDPESGSLRAIVRKEQKKDKLSFRSLPLLKGVGGRFSELNMGLLHLAVTGVNIQQVLDGAKAMAHRCSQRDLLCNPACLYAMLQTILYRKKGKTIAVLMPFCESLKSTADWYVQLLAESLGKRGRGRTPISSRGSNDLHSIQQNNIEGENNKALTFIRVEKFSSEIKIPGKAGILSGKKFSALLKLAQEATEWALARANRPNCTITLPEISPYYWGGLLFFFELATALEGELLEVNAYDQPGVEGYKNYMYYKLGKASLPPQVGKEIESNPLTKDSRFVL